MGGYTWQSMTTYLADLLAEGNEIEGEGVVVPELEAEAEQYWREVYQQLQVEFHPAMVKTEDDPINRLVALSMRAPNDLERRAVYLLNLEFKRRVEEPQYDTLLVNLKRVINKKRSESCELAQLEHNPDLRREYSSPQKLKQHVWDDDGCTICNDDYTYVVAMLLRSLATVKKKPTVN